MAFLRRRMNQEGPSEKEKPTRILSSSRRNLKHHYILEPMGKPQNATSHNATSQEEKKDEVQEMPTDKPLIIMPPGPVIIEEHDQENDEEDSVEDEAPAGEDVDHDSGEDKVAAMIAEMQKGMIDEKKKKDAEESENEADVDKASGDQVDNGEEASGEDDEEDIAVPDNDEGSTGDEKVEEDVIDEEEEQQASAESENDEVSNGGGEDAIEEGDGEEEASGQETSEPPATQEPGNEEESTSPAATEEMDDVSENDQDSSGGEADGIEEGDGKKETSGQATTEPLATPEPGDEETNAQQTSEPADTLPEPASEETSASPTATPSAVSNEQNVVATASPSPAPSSVATEDQNKPAIIKHPDAIPPNTEGDAPTDPTDSPSAAPSKTPLDINKVSHEDAPLPKTHDKQPHSATSGSTDTAGSSFGALCRHPSGLVQQTNCKIVLGMQSHPIAFSAAFLVLSVWGCCLCRRLCKGRSRRDEHGEYREVAAQYDDMLFQDTFDDNYSASFADDRSADGSISDEEDDWTKGPNIELSEIPHKENDDLTLEEMNG